MKIRRFPYGVLVLGGGWFIRLWRLRIVWGTPHDPTITRAVADEDLRSHGDPVTYTIRYNPSELFKGEVKS